MECPSIRHGLVSILTPCYNASAYISYLLESVLKQDYPAIEMVVVNDGSTDNTEDVVHSYAQRFVNKGYSLQIINQQNGGQSLAIKNGLKYISGEFLVWPDSDDYYATTDAISVMVNAFLHSNKDLGLVRTREALVRRDANGDKIIGTYGLGLSGLEFSKTIFKECLLQENGFYYTPGGFMVRTEYLFKSTKDIYVNRLTGQNAQLLFPVLYHYNCYTIPEIHHNVLIRTDSHSRSITGNFDKSIRLFDAYEETNGQTLSNIIDISTSDLAYYHSLNQINYDLKRLLVSCIFNESAHARSYYKRLKKAKAKIPSSILLRYFLVQAGIFQQFKSLKNLFRNK